MTGHLVGTLARRGVEAAREHLQDPNETMTKLPGWGIALLSITILSFAFFASSIEYTIRLVMGHLAMVEHPETTVEVQLFEPASKEDLKIAQNLVDCGFIESSAITEPTIVTKVKPITSSIRRTKRHITAIGGGKARWRGLAIFILYALCAGISRTFLQALLRVVPFGCVLADVAAGLLTARLHCAWTHQVISMPSTKTFRERMITRAQWRELMMPTTFSHAAHSISYLAIRQMYIVSVQAAEMLRAEKTANWIVVCVAFIPTIVGASVLGLFIMLPAYVALVRKEASLLAPEEETIVAMDRTFGGKLTYIGQKLNFVDAWNSFTWEARRRLVKLYIKFFFIMVLLVFTFSHIVALELFLMVGDNAMDIVKGVHQHMSL